MDMLLENSLTKLAAPKELNSPLLVLNSDDQSNPDSPVPQLKQRIIAVEVSVETEESLAKQLELDNKKKELQLMLEHEIARL